MTPIFDKFTKNLSGCGGCGQVPQSVFEAIKKGEKVTFIVSVQVEAINGKVAANMIPDEAGEVVGVTLKPQQNASATQFQRTSTQPVPSR